MSGPRPGAEGARHARWRSAPSGVPCRSVTGWRDLPPHLAMSWTGALACADVWHVDRSNGTMVAVTPSGMSGRSGVVVSCTYCGAEQLQGADVDRYTCGSCHETYLLRRCPG